MSVRKFAVLDVEDAEKWKGHTKELPNVKGEINIFCKVWIETFGEDGDSWETFKCYESKWPSLEYAKGCDALFITGSHYSACDDSQDWIPKFAEVLVEYVEAGVIVVGGCFGCQILARALGGRVDANPSGRFVLKVESIELLSPLLKYVQSKGDSSNTVSWMLVESHGDQVLELPPGAELLARSQTALNEIWCYKNRVLAFQSHPELSAEITCEKIWTTLKNNGRLDTQEAQESHTSLTTVKPDPAPLVSFVKDFIGSRPRKASESASYASKMKMNMSKLYDKTVDFFDVIPRGTMSMSFPLTAKNEPQSKALENETEEGGASTSGKSLRDGLDEEMGQFEEEFVNLMHLELDHGLQEYNKLEGANRVASAEVQKMGDAVQQINEGRTESRRNCEEIASNAREQLKELDVVVTKLEKAVNQLDTETAEMKRSFKK